MITKEQQERLEYALDILTSVYWDIREQIGSKTEARRLDTILGKLDNLAYLDHYKELGRH